MTIHSIVCKKLLCTNAHLVRRVAAHHLKVYICGSRNGIAILDSDKTLICLRNVFNLMGSPIRQKSRSFLLKTHQIIISDIMEEMASCSNDSQWRIGDFLTNSCSSPKKIRSRKNKIHFGSNQQPDCVVILNADRKSSVILEADRSQIPIASLVFSTIPWGSYKRITYPIPANGPIQFVYLFRHSITMQNNVHLDITSSHRIRLQDDIVTGFHFSVSERFLTFLGSLIKLMREGYRIFLSQRFVKTFFTLCFIVVTLLAKSHYYEVAFLFLLVNKIQCDFCLYHILSRLGGPGVSFWQEELRVFAIT
uniref:ribosomal protein S2 n=1 Tax=Eichhornia crassipes TaxID=44947 RepID=UPI002A83E1A6|nr:ribosomal protein S2 [Pontederia crassipes]WOW96093.1 ribosomal protein S2 [Pontederia crassipes]